MTTTKQSTRARFFRAGGIDQVRLDEASDLAGVAGLDQKLWLALTCPVNGLHFDSRTLHLLDTDGDGRVRAPEIVAAITLMTDCLKGLSELTNGKDALPLSAFNEATEKGKLMLASARRILASQGNADATSISIDDVKDSKKIFAETRFNGDGIIDAEVVGDPDARDVVGEIITSLGSVLDAAGRAGVNQEKVDEFFKELVAFDAWHQELEAARKEVCPLGDDTKAAVLAIDAVRAKIDDYFARVRLTHFDPRAISAVNRKEEEYLELAASDMTISADEVVGFPIARIEDGRALPLSDGINPAWIDRINTLKTAAIDKLLKGGMKELTEDDWAKLQSKVAAYRGWLAKKAGEKVESLGIERVRAILASSAKENLSKLIAKDVAAQPEMDAITDVERLVHYSRDLHPLLNNFVSFSRFYRREKAIFQAGELYLDSRRCHLCVKVDSVAAHTKLAALSKTFLAYCECTRLATGEKMIIAAAFTNGDSDALMVGRNGLFYDRDGNDWDATIVHIIDHPISIRQAFWSPYKKTVRAIEEMIAKRAEAADKVATTNLTSAVESTGAAAAKGEQKKPKFEVGTIAALGVAVGGITAAFSAIFASFLGLGKWIPLGIIGIVLAISGPSMLIAWLKLRQRSLGPILEGNGWAVNGKVRINMLLGAALTELAVLPAGAERSLVDPYAVQGMSWIKKLGITLLVMVTLAVSLHVGGVIDGGKVLQKIESYLPWGKPVPVELEDASSSADGAAPAKGEPVPEVTGPPAEGG